MRSLSRQTRERKRERERDGQTDRQTDMTGPVFCIAALAACFVAASATPCELSGTLFDCTNERLQKVPWIDPVTVFLQLDMNFIDEVKRSTFAGLGEVRKIDLSENQITALGAEVRGSY